MAQHFINGQWVPAASGQTLPVLNPATGEAFDTIARGDARDVDAAVAAARADGARTSGSQPSGRGRGRRTRGPRRSGSASRPAGGTRAGRPSR